MRQTKRRVTECSPREELAVERAQSSLLSTTQSRKLVNFAMNLRSHLCPGIILICYTELTSSKKGETAVHGCNPTLSVPVVLEIRKVNFFT